MTPADSGPAPIRIPFRVFAGLFALLAGLICVASLAEQFQSESRAATQRLWLALLTVTFGFTARYFGHLAFTGRGPPRPPATPWRRAFDALFGIGATAVILAALYAFFGPGSTTAEVAWLVALLLAFMRGMRWYCEHGAASERRRKPQR
jgi:uncharacterized membrane protein YfcA